MSDVQTIFSRYFLFFLILIASVLAYLWFDKVLFNPTPSGEQTEGHVAKDYAVSLQLSLFNSDGKLECQLDIRKMTRYLDSKKTFVVDPHLEVFSSGRVISRITAKTGLLNTDASIIELFGGGELLHLADNNHQEIRILSDYFKLLTAEQVVSSNQHVKLISGRNVTHAENLLYEHRSRRLDLWGNVRGQFEDSSGTIDLK